MKNLVLASALGTLAGTFAVPALHGPMHFAVTKPHGMFGLLPVPVGNPGVSSVTLGTVPTDFVITDVVLSGELYRHVIIAVNGTPVLNMGSSPTNYVTDGRLHLTTGIPVPAGATISVQASTPSVGTQTPSPITVAGYLQ